MGLRTKLFIAVFALAGSTVVAVYLFLSARLPSEMRDRVREDLRVRAELVKLQVSQAEHPTDLRRWDHLADQLGQSGQVRVTLIGEKGEVLGDSELSAAELQQLEPHFDRPEVARALEDGVGESERFSTTVERRMLYIATVLPVGVVRVARVSMPLTRVERVAGSLQHVLTFGLFLALGLGVVLSSVAAQLASMPARELVRAATRMADGDLDVRVRSTGKDELGDMGRSLDRLASVLSSSLRDLREERDRLDRVLNSMQEGILLLDAEDTIQVVNPAARQMLLMTSDALGSAFADNVPNKDLRDLLSECRGTGNVTIGELELRSPAMNLLVHVVPLIAERAGHLIVLVDVTHLRRLEVVRKQFVQNASHELRTPITAILSAAETLSAPGADDPKVAAPFIKMILRNAERLRLLVDDLLELSRIESLQFGMDLQATKPSEVVEQALSVLHPKAEQKKIRLEVESISPDVVCVSDPQALERVLFNLVENAIKYCSAGTRVRVRVRVQAEKVLLEVEDDGPGISEPHLNRIFERFYRVDAGRSREMGGTGLGLSIVKNLVEAMHGAVSVSSVLGQGTRFTVAMTLVPEGFEFDGRDLQESTPPSSELPA